MTRSRQPSESTVQTPTVPTSPARVAFVGSGPGDPGLLTLRGRDLLAAADVVVLDRLARDEGVLRHVREDAQIIDAADGAEELTHAMRAKALVKAAKSVTSGGLVVRLMEGDPATFNGLVEEVRACRRAGITFDIVPGVSPVSAVPTYAGVPLTSKHATSVHLVHVDASEHDYGRYTTDDCTLVLLGSSEGIRQALASLLAAGRDGAAHVVLTERGTTSTQASQASTLGEIDARFVGKAPACPSIAVVSPNAAFRDEFSWFETKPLFGWKVLVPRTQAQAGSMIDRLASYGATADVVPTISVEPPRTPQQMERAIKGLVTGRYEWVGFTSVNAVRAVRERFEQFGLDARAFAGLKVAAVGGVTA